MRRNTRNFVTLTGIAALAAIFLAFSGGFSGGQAESVAENSAGKESPLEVRDAYAFATAPSQKNGAVFLRILNHGAESAQITGAAAEAAAHTALHASDTDGGGTMRMRHVSSIEIPAGGEAVLKPAGDHIMLMGLKAPLNAGDTLEIVLETAGQGEIALSVPVIAPGETP